MDRHHIVALPVVGWFQPKLTLLQYQHQPNPNIFLPRQESASFSVWVNHLSKEAKWRFVCLLYLSTSSLLWRGQGSGFVLGEVGNGESLLLHRNGRSEKISLKYFQVVEKICVKLSS